MTASWDVMRAELTAVVSGGRPGLSMADELCATSAGLLGVDGAALSMVYRGASTGTFGASSEASRRLDEYQFTFGEGPCLDAVATREPVLVPDLNAPREERWPLMRGALLEDGIQSVFALPIMLSSVCVGAVDLFRAEPGPLEGDALAGAMLTAELASAPLLDLMAEVVGLDGDEDAPGAGTLAGSSPVSELERVEVYQATGMVVAALDIDAAEALVRLRAHAIATGQTARQVASAIVERKLMLERDPRRGAGEGSR